MTTIVAPICLGCTHYRRDDDAKFACDAFPDGIPDAIIESSSDHRQPVAGDNGIRFDPRTPADARYAADLFSGEP